MTGLVVFDALEVPLALCDYYSLNGYLKQLKLVLCRPTVPFLSLWPAEWASGTYFHHLTDLLHPSTSYQK